MKISIDYDSTFTEDPDFWREVIRIGRERGHTFFCITGRAHPPGLDEPAIPCEVITSPMDYKNNTARNLGHHIDVWIDDCPAMIMKSFDFDDYLDPLENS